MAINSSASSAVDLEKSASPTKAHASPSDDSLNASHPSHGEANAAILPQVENEPQGDPEKGEGQRPAGGPSGGFDVRENPDGGLTAWLVVLGASCALFCSFGWINCIGVFQAYYETHQLKDLSPSTIAWIPSIESFMMFVWGPVIGKLYDNYGPRQLMLVGTFLHVFGLMMTSLSTKYYQFILAQGICSATGASMIFYPSLSTCATWFFKKRALAFGIATAGSSLGGVIFPIMVQRLVGEVGFPWTIRICAFLILGLMIIANLTIKSRMTHRLTPVVLMEFIRPFREMPFALLAFGSFLFFLGMFLPFNFIVLEARTHGMSAPLATYLVSIMNAASIFGRTIPGYVADRVGRFNVHIVMCLFTGILVLALWLPAAANAPLIVFAVLYGFGSGAFISLGQSCIAQISDVRQIGVRSGTMYAVFSIAVLITSPIGGVLITRWDGKYTGLKIFSGVMLLGGASIITLTRIRIAGPKLVVKT